MQNIMSGFPPAPEHVVTQANMLHFPQSRWAFHHIRQLMPTVEVWAGPAGAISEFGGNPWPVSGKRCW